HLHSSHEEETFFRCCPGSCASDGSEAEEFTDAHVCLELPRGFTKIPWNEGLARSRVQVERAEPSYYYTGFAEFGSERRTFRENHVSIGIESAGDIESLTRAPPENRRDGDGPRSTVHHGDNAGVSGVVGLWSILVVHVIGVCREVRCAFRIAIDLADAKPRIHRHLFIKVTSENKHQSLGHTLTRRFILENVS